MSIVQNFSIPQGDDIALRFTIDDPDDGDLTGSSIKLWIASDVDSPALLEKDNVTGSPTDITITDGPLRKFSVALTAAETDLLDGLYYYEVEVTDLDGFVTTVTTGTMRVFKTLIR